MANPALGVCPSCQKNAGVVNTQADSFECRGCGAKWLGARLPDRR